MGASVACILLWGHLIFRTTQSDTWKMWCKSNHLGLSTPGKMVCTYFCWVCTYYIECLIFCFHLALEKDATSSLWSTLLDLSYRIVFSVHTDLRQPPCKRRWTASVEMIYFFWFSLVPCLSDGSKMLYFVFISHLNKDTFCWSFDANLLLLLWCYKGVLQAIFFLNKYKLLLHG